ncbi:Sugar transferase involved in LPS biosynthesis (colanic, teichoic acid) [Loktanella fryxellensis]|uniref:Sugar transferase involved in LPS biosynthesis (Colanic, teichoic acid) n=1 Tax=Loktanella fryxellensis TaxID=245187 RepID=A0A1H8GX13_9RHOB|nr:sugar transferase [Loktanella fryxellensis]SEN47788.1 Sugar transferase involved in LPS biosynthesis (colanic, teichoic acid) [Loktanella fryxellensis]
MTLGKRLLDVTLALLLGTLLLPLLAVLLVVMAVAEGRPLFYVSERMRSPTRAFGLIKLRTMPVGADRVGGVTGGDKQARMRLLHRLLRRSRADEIPQLWNVLRGDMSLVGPRPPLRRYVEDYPDIYGPVLQSRPGITGLASLTYHAHEERLLAACTTPEATDAVYRRRCVPAKARLDLIYARHRNLCWDLLLIGRTAARPFRRK